VPKVEGARTIRNSILMETRPMVTTKRKQAGKVDKTKEAPIDDDYPN
jgi:hypothetical protein